MQRREHNRLVYYQFEQLNGRDGLRHGIFTRLGGASVAPWATLNLGHTVGDDLAAVEENHERVCLAMGLKRSTIVTSRQVHGNRVVAVGRADGGLIVPATDGLITHESGTALLQRFADCVPLVLYDPVRHAAGLAHAGWRGTIAQVARRTVAAMVDHFGCDPADLRAGIGPGIGPCCYQVGPEVVQQVQAIFDDTNGLLVPGPNRSWHLDLWAANARQLAGAGIKHIEIAGICTACQVNEWFSHRAEQGRTGRFGVVVVLD